MDTRIVHASSFDSLLSRWKRVYNHHVQPYGSKSAIPNQFDAQRRRSVPWSLLSDRGYRRRQCRCRQAIPRSTCGPIYREPSVQKDDQGSVVVLVDTITGCCHCLYSHHCHSSYLQRSWIRYRYVYFGRLATYSLANVQIRMGCPLSMDWDLDRHLCSLDSTGHALGDHHLGRRLWHRPRKEAQARHA